MKILLFGFFVLLSPLCWSDNADFDFSGSKLEGNWAELTAMYQLPFPDAEWVERFIQRYPSFQNTEHNQQDYAAISEGLQEVFRLHFAGRYKEAAELGNSLGGVANIPGLYAELIYATTLTDAKAKWSQFKKIEGELTNLKQATSGYWVVEFNLAYLRSRMLEMMSTSDAKDSGYVGKVKKSLSNLQKQHPDQVIISATYGSFQAGVVERVGSMLSNMAFGISEQRALAAYQVAERNTPSSSQYHLEYAIALSRLNSQRYRADINQQIELCLSAKVHHAEEAMAQAICEKIVAN